jgi:hypothetical protein
MASEGHSGFTVRYGNVLVCDCPSSVIALKIRGLELMRIKAGSHIDRSERHESPLFVRSLIAPAVMLMLGIMGVVTSTIATQLMRVTHLVVVVFIGMGDPNRTGLLGSLVMDMGIMGAKMAFLGMSVKDLIMAFHLIDMFTKHLSVRAVRDGAGRDNDRSFSESGMPRGLDSASADGAVVGNFQNFGDGLHGWHLCFQDCARNWAVSAGNRLKVMILYPQGVASV